MGGCTTTMRAWPCARPPGDTRRCAPPPTPTSTSAPRAAWRLDGPPPSPALMPAMYLYRAASTRVVSSASLANLETWASAERTPGASAVDDDGCLLDNLTLELRVNPPTVDIANDAHERWTVVTVDSANRPGSLIHVSLGGVGGRWRRLVAGGAHPGRLPLPRCGLQVVQHFTELGLRIHSARISSDGGWFVDGALGGVGARGRERGGHPRSPSRRPPPHAPPCTQSSTSPSPMEKRSAARPSWTASRRRARGAGGGGSGAAAGARCARAAGAHTTTRPSCCCCCCCKIQMLNVWMDDGKLAANGGAPRAWGGAPAAAGERTRGRAGGRGGRQLPPPHLPRLLLLPQTRLTTWGAWRPRCLSWRGRTAPGCWPR